MDMAGLCPPDASAGKANMVTRVKIIWWLLLKDEALPLQPGSVDIVSGWGAYTWHSTWLSHSVMTSNHPCLHIMTQSSKNKYCGAEQKH